MTRGLDLTCRIQIAPCSDTHVAVAHVTQSKALLMLAATVQCRVPALHNSNVDYSTTSVLIVSASPAFPPTRAIAVMNLSTASNALCYKMHLIRKCPDLQLWPAWQLVSAIFHRRADIPFLQQRHMLNMLQHIVTMMSMNTRACQEASKQAARHKGMQLVAVKYCPWLPPPDCMLTWQQMTAAMSWQQIRQVMVCFSYTLCLQCIVFILLAT